MNNSSKTQTFFSETVNGTNEQFVPNKLYQFGKHTVAGIESIRINNFFESISGNFDKHIACSIPLFREAQIEKIRYIKRLVNHDSPFSFNLLDIGGSEATTLKTLYEFIRHSNKPLNLVNLEPNKDMRHASASDGIHTIGKAFYEGFDDIQKFEPKYKFDVINETMTFQFISSEREKFIDEVCNLLKVDGVFITDEKFQLKNDPDKQLKNETIKDDRHKASYFNSDSISAKKETVLTGMLAMQYDFEAYKALLKIKFRYVKMYYKAGNFAGFICTNDLNKIKLYEGIGNLGLIYNVFNS